MVSETEQIGRNGERRRSGGSRLGLQAIFKGGEELAGSHPITRMWYVAPLRLPPYRFRKKTMKG
jgi:hypothetical protein